MVSRNSIVFGLPSGKSFIQTLGAVEDTQFSCLQKLDFFDCFLGPRGGQPCRKGWEILHAGNALVLSQKPKKPHKSH